MTEDKRKESIEDVIRQVDEMMAEVNSAIDDVPGYSDELPSWIVDLAESRRKRIEGNDEPLKPPTVPKSEDFSQNPLFQFSKPKTLKDDAGQIEPPPLPESHREGSSSVDTDPVSELPPVDMPILEVPSGAKLEPPVDSTKNGGGDYRPDSTGKIDLDDAYGIGMRDREADDVRESDDLASDMSDYGRRNIELIKMMQEIMIEGISETDSIVARFHRVL